VAPARDVVDHNEAGVLALPVAVSLTLETMPAVVEKQLGSGSGGLRGRLWPTVSLLLFFGLGHTGIGGT
jgi:hypothetical protein